MSDILFADKKLLQSYNTYNQDNFNHGYDEKELTDRSQSFEGFMKRKTYGRKKEKIHHH